MKEMPEPPRIEDAAALVVKLLGQLLTVEEMLARSVLPKLREETQDDELKQAFSEHLEQTRGHVDQVRAAFAELGVGASGQEAKGLEGLKEEREAIVAALAPALRDGFNASAAMGAEHYEIATYEAAIRLAEALGADTVGSLLRANLREEVAALEQLAGHATRLAEQAAKQPAMR